MTSRLDNTRPARRAQALRTACALVALAGAGTPLALGQATSTAHFIPAATSGISEPETATPAGEKPQLTAHPLDDTNTTATPPQFGDYLGTSPINGTAVQQQVDFVTNSTSASYVPTVSLQYGISYSAGPVSCTQTIVPTNNNPLTPVPYVQTCSVTVTFAPQYPGGHRDAMYILDDGGAHLAGVFLYGIGQAPQLMIQPGVPTSVTLPGHLYGATTDEAGTYYVYANNDFYTVKEDGVYTLLASSVPSTGSLSADGAGDLFEPGPYPNNYGGWEYGGYNAITLCYTAPGLLNQNPQILATTVCFDSPATVTTGNLGTYYDADGGGETQEYDGQNILYTKGLLLQTYEPQGAVMSPTAPTEKNGISYPAYGRQPLQYPILSGNYGPNGMVVDPYENMFFTDPNLGIAVWCEMAAYSDVGISSAITGSSNGCGGWGTSMVLLNQYIGTNPNLAVDAADTLYAGQGGIEMYSATNNYASSITSIGGYGAAPSLAPDGTVYVENGSTLNIIDRFQGAVNFGSNNGVVSNPYTVTLYNGGNEPLTISSIVPNGGAGYTVGPATSNGCTTNGFTLAPGTICQFLVTSTVPHAGTLTGSVAITSNSLNAPGTVQQVALTGYTSGIYVAATPNPFVFPAQTAGTTSVPLPVTVTNTSVGSNAVGYGSTVAITSGFTSSNPAFTASLGAPTAPTYCGNPLASGATCLIQVTFNPTAVTSYSGTISWYEQITGGGPSMKVSFAVSGNGVPLPLLIPISENVKIADSPLVTPSLLIPVSETINVTDSGVPVPSLLIPVNETIHVIDTPAPSLSQGTPTITSVSAILPQQAQPITISGSGFGTHTPYTGDSNYIELIDTSAGGWDAGHAGAAVTLAVSSWTNTQIVLSGFSGSYGSHGWCISPGDQLSIRVWNAQTGNGPAAYPITVSSGTNTCALAISSVSPILPQQTQTITISGSDFGTQAPYTGDSNYIELIDTSAGGWDAGHSGAAVTLAVSSWTNSQIVLSGFGSAYGTHSWCISPGDQLSVKVWNAQTGYGPAVYPIAVSSGTNTCTVAINSVSQILPQQTQPITINGTGFGSQSPYTGDSKYIELVDSTGTSWNAGHSGAAVTLAVSSWTDTQIVLSGFSGSYGTHAWCIRPGDQLSVKVWNAQTGIGPAVYPIAASSGTNTCP